MRRVYITAEQAPSGDVMLTVLEYDLEHDVSRPVQSLKFQSHLPGRDAGLLTMGLLKEAQRLMTPHA